VNLPYAICLAQPVTIRTRLLSQMSKLSWPSTATFPGGGWSWVPRWWSRPALGEPR